MKIQLLKLLVLGVIILFSYNTQAQTTYIVTNTNDSGAGSLRAVAAGAANGDIIRFSPSLLTAAVDSISLSTEINFGARGIVIKGLYSATDTLFISGANSSRIFTFGGAGYVGAGKVVLDSLVLINGNGVGIQNFSSTKGGAVYYVGDYADTLFILNSVLRNNRASEEGGGIYSPTIIYIENSTIINNNSSYGGGISCAILRMYNSKITGNSATYFGGGIYSQNSYISSVNLENSTVSANTAVYSGGGIYSASAVNNPSDLYPSIVSLVNSSLIENSSSDKGGGIFSSSLTSASKVNLKNSTVIGNIASGNGGGIYSFSNSDSSIVLLENSTVTGNISHTAGGGIASVSYPNSSIVNIINSTITGNMASTYGGGIFSYPATSTSVIVKSSIVWVNGADNIYNNYSSQSINSQGNNIFSNAPLGSVVSDHINVNSTSLNLLPLAFNGGYTKTIMPGPGSIAINSGNPIDISDAQNRPIIGIRDIGAAEYNCVTDSIETETTCSSYLWIDGNTYIVDTIISFTNLSSIGGVCDSTFTLHLTVNSNTKDTTVTAYGIFTWFGSIYDSVGVFTDTNNLMNILGCDSTIILHLTVMPDTSITQNGLVLTSNQNGANYQWLNCSNGCSVIAGETNQSYALTNNGSYAVQISLNGLTDTSSTIVFNSLGINDFTQSSYKLYPNPVKNELTIESQGDINQIEIYNLTGQLLQTLTPTSKLVKIDLAIYERGVYLVKLHTDKGIVSTSRVVKE